MERKSQFYISLMGQPVITQNNIPVDIKRRKCRALIFYLAAQGCPVGREKLQTIFWPEADPSSARHNLNVNLYEIKKQFPQLIENTDFGSSLQLVNGVEVDVSIFESLLSAETVATVVELQQALELYRGEFLDGFQLSDSPFFDNWRATEAVMLSSKYIDAQVRYAEMCSAAGDNVQAITAIQSALNNEPLREDLYRKLMIYQKKNGDYLQVQQTFTKLKKVLMEEINIEPMAETSALYNSIMRNCPQSADSTATVRVSKPKRFAAIPSDNLMPFIGREAEMAQVMQLLMNDSHQAVFIDGFSGSGKTRFMHEVINRWPGIALYGSCTAESETIPFQPFVMAIKEIVSSKDWVDQYVNIKRNINFVWWRNLRWLIPEIDPFDTTPIIAPTNQLSLMDALKRFIFLLGQDQRLLLAIDDIHLVSHETGLFMAHLVSDAGQPNICYLGTKNPSKYNPDVDKAVYRYNYIVNTTVIKLDRLDYNCVVQFANLINPNDIRIHRWLESKTAGNAYNMVAYVRWALSRLGEPNCMELSASREASINALLEDTSVPSEVSGYVLSCMANLSPNASRLMYVASVCGVEFNFEAVAEAADLEIYDALDALQEVMRYSLLSSCANGNYRFHHTAIRDAVFSDMPAAFHRKMHQRIESILNRIENS